MVERFAAALLAERAAGRIEGMREAAAIIKERRPLWEEATAVAKSILARAREMEKVL